MRKRYILWLLGITVALAMVTSTACGGGGEEAEPTATEAGPTATEGPAAEVPGVTDTEIILGTHQPITGVAASYAVISAATKAYFDYINETEDGVYGRKITYLVEDDEYIPSNTVNVVRKLVEQDEVFAILNGLGTATHMQVVDYLLDEGVPDMFISTGTLEWTKDPEARPNAFGLVPNYIGEGIVLGQYIAETYPDMKLGFIGQNDDFGQDGLKGIEMGVGDALEILEPEWFEAVDTDLSAQVGRLQSGGADVVVVFATPLQAGGAPRYAREQLNWDVPFVITGVSASELTLLVGDAANMEGTVSQVAIRQAYETDDPGVAKHIEILNTYAEGLAPSYLTLYGQLVAETMVAVLEEAGPDLTREGLIEAAESLTDVQCSICLFANSMSAEDHDPGQHIMLAKVENGVWVPFGDAYGWEGILPEDLTLDSIETEPSPYEE